jgi:hypothetical protein
MKRALFGTAEKPCPSLIITSHESENLGEEPPTTRPSRAPPPDGPREILRKSRSKPGVVKTLKGLESAGMADNSGGAALGWIVPFGAQLLRGLLLQPLFGRTPQFRQELVCIAGFAAKIVLMASLDLFLQRSILVFQVVLQVIYVHDANDRNAVFLKDEVLAVYVRATDNLAEVDACPG